VIREGTKSDEVMRGSARRAPGWPWGRGSAAMELGGLTGGAVPEGDCHSDSRHGARGMAMEAPGPGRRP
jgi:hypothetical protein